MKSENNIHEGHRQRLLDKLVKYPESLNDHELLELAYFFSIPRQDTNPLAHKTLRTFGSLSNVFSARFNELVSVDGVGKRSAELILLMSEILNRLVEKKDKKVVLDTSEKIKKELKTEFEKLDRETCLLILLDAKYTKLTQLNFGDMRRFSVDIDTNEIVGVFGALKPAFAILAHNHTGTSAQPSKQDDLATKKINVICSLHGVSLLEHVIFCGEKVYSYRQDNRLDMIKNYADINNLLKDSNIPTI